MKSRTPLTEKTPILRAAELLNVSLEELMDAAREDRISLELQLPWDESPKFVPLTTAGLDAFEQSTKHTHFVKVDNQHIPQKSWYLPLEREFLKAPKDLIAKLQQHFSNNQKSCIELPGGIAQYLFIPKDQYKILRELVSDESGAGSNKNQKSVVTQRVTPIPLKIERWGELSIEFRDDASVKMFTKGSKPIIVSAQSLGMIDNRNPEFPKPKDEWYELITILSHGKIDWGATSSSKPVRTSALYKRIYRLNKALREAFNMQSAPIPYDKEQKAYIPKFQPILRKNPILSQT